MVSLIARPLMISSFFNVRLLRKDHQSDWPSGPGLWQVVDQGWESLLIMTGGGSRVPMGWESPLKCQYTNLIWEREEGIHALCCSLLDFWIIHIIPTLLTMHMKRWLAMHADPLPSPLEIQDGILPCLLLYRLLFTAHCDQNPVHINCN